MAVLARRRSTAVCDDTSFLGSLWARSARGTRNTVPCGPHRSTQHVGGAPLLRAGCAAVSATQALPGWCAENQEWSHADSACGRSSGSPAAPDVLAPVMSAPVRTAPVRFGSLEAHTS